MSAGNNMSSSVAPLNDVKEAKEYTLSVFDLGLYTFLHQLKKCIENNSSIGDALKRDRIAFIDGISTLLNECVTKFNSRNYGTKDDNVYLYELVKKYYDIKSFKKIVSPRGCRQFEFFSDELGKRYAGREEMITDFIRLNRALCMLVTWCLDRNIQCTQEYVPQRVVDRFKKGLSGEDE